MGSYGESWGTLAWAVDPALSAQAIATGAQAAGTAVSNDGKLDTEVSIEVQYGATYAADVVLYLLRDVDGTNYEGQETAQGYAVPGAASTTRRRTVTVPASVGRFKPFVDNPSGASVTVTVRTRQSTGVTA